MAGPLIWNGNFSRNLTSDILLPGSTYNDLLVGKQIAFNSSTGIVSGGILTINADPTKFDLTAGVGYITNYTAPNAPTYKPITWNAFTAQTTLGLTTTDTTYIMIDNTGAIFQLNTYPTADQRRANIFVGLLTHAGHTVNTYGVNSPDFSASSSSQVYDFFDALGPFNINGNVVSTNGANLQIQKSAGNLFFRGYNYATNINNPHNVSIAANAPITMLRGLQTGGALGAFTTVDPANYDVAGVLTTITGPNATATIQRVFLAPNNVVLVQYGQALYNNITTAIASIGTDPFVINAVLPGKSILIAYVIAQKNCTNLTNTAQAAILPAPRFAVGAGGGINQVLSLQQSYDASVQPQIVLDAAHGGLQFYDNATPLGTDLLTVANSTGATKYLNVTAAALTSTLPFSTTNATASTTTSTGAIIATGGLGIGGAANIGGNLGVTGTATAGQIIDSGLTANTAVYANASKQLTSSATTPTQLGYLSTTTSDVQTQLDTKLGFNLIPDPLFATQTVAQWSKGITGALTNGLPSATPTFGSGSSGNLTLSAVTSGQIQGTASMSLASSATNVAGDMIATGAIAIDPEYRAKVLSIKFAYQMISGTAEFSGTSTNSWAWACYDVTNSAWIGTAGQFNLTQSSGAGICTGTFQVPYNTASVRFVIYNVKATTGATTIYFDDFYMGLQNTVTSSPVGPTTSWTPTLTGFGTISNLVAKYQTIGDRISGQVSFTCGTVAASVASCTLPYLIDFTKVAYGSTSGSPVGSGNGITTTGTAILTNQYAFVNTIFSNDTGKIYFSQTTIGNEYNQTVASSFSITGNRVAFSFYDIPVQGLSNQVLSSADTDTRVTALQYTGNAGGSVTANVTNIDFTTKVSDTNAAWSGTVFTAPVTGFYQILGSVKTASAQIDVNAYINGTVKYTFASSTGANRTVNPGSAFVSLNAGDTLSLRSSVTATLSNDAIGHWISINRLSGPSTITASETVVMRATGTATGTLAASVNNTIFPTVTKDSHNAYNSTTGVYTAPVSGTYSVTGRFRIAGTSVANAATNIYIAKNASVYALGSWRDEVVAITATIQANVTDTVPCLAGDTINIQSYTDRTSPSFSASTGEFTFTIFRIGN